MKPVKTMIREISAIAVEAGLVNADWPARLRVKIRKGNGGACGGIELGRPMISVCANHDWDFNADVRDVRKVLDWLEEFFEMEQDKNKFLKKWNR